MARSLLCFGGMSDAKIASKVDIIRFVLGGYATFTLRSPTGGRFTFSVAKGKKGRDGQEPPWFVKLRVGPDYSFFGTIFVDHSFRFSPKSPLKADPGVMAFAWFWEKLLDARVSDFVKLEFWHEGTCSACGRELTLPESISRGLGPVCLKKVAALVV